MASITRVCAVFLHILVWSFLGTIGGESHDVSCLKSVKQSLQDPFGYLQSWNFNNATPGFICGFTGITCWNAVEDRVIRIELNHMALKGPFPRGINSCSNLMMLDLTGNQLFGPIPSDISRILPNIVSLDLSYNNFSGQIPPDIANCSYLNALVLDNNQLTGTIPPEIGLLGRVKTFSVSSNLLSGSTPRFVNAVVSRESYENNLDLCGEPLDPCRIIPTESDYFKSGFVVGFVVSVVSVLTVFMSYFVASVRGMKLSEVLFQVLLNLLKELKTKRNHSHDHRNVSFVQLLQEDSQETSMLVKFVSKMSYIDLSEVADNFSPENIIGSGRMGTTYKAMLPNGWLLAVKRLHGTPHFEEHFVTELKTLGRLRHVNMVPLLGFCIESEERLLVYSYMSNGSLYERLHHVKGEAKAISWPLRMKIAVGIARGLVWLHNSCNPCIVHLDICSKHILLDRNFEPKISNFGEAVLLRSNETDSSKSFSFDSEFWKSSLVKEDVYCFGIVLLELITGEDPSRMVASSLSNGDNHNDLNQWISNLSISSSLHDVVEKSLIGKGFDLEIFQLLRVAFDCAHPLTDQRPTMIEVYRTIGAIGKRHCIKAGSNSSLQATNLHL